MWNAIFNSSSHPCAATDGMFGVGVDMSSNFILGVALNIFSEVILGLGVDVLSDTTIVLMDTPPVTLTVVVTHAVVDVPGVSSFITFGVVPAIDVDMFADENVRGLEAVITPSKFSFPAESMRAFRCQ